MDFKVIVWSYSLLLYCSVACIRYLVVGWIQFYDITSFDIEGGDENLIYRYFSFQVVGFLGGFYVVHVRKATFFFPASAFLLFPVSLYTTYYTVWCIYHFLLVVWLKFCVSLFSFQVSQIWLLLLPPRMCTSYPTCRRMPPGDSGCCGDSSAAMPVKNIPPTPSPSAPFPSDCQRKWSHILLTPKQDQLGL